MDEQQERRADDPKLRVIHERINALDKKVEANTALTQQTHDNTVDLVEAWKAMAGAFKVLGWLAGVAKWISVIVAAVAGGYGLLHMVKTGTVPPRIDVPQ